MAEGEAPRSELKILVSMTENNIMSQLQESVTAFNDAIGKLTDTVQGVIDAGIPSAGGAGGGRGGRVRQPGTDNDDYDDDSGRFRTRRTEGSQFIPFSFWKDEIAGRQQDMSSEVMRRGFEMPRFGSWTAQDYLAHIGYVGQRIGYRQGRDNETGQRDFILGGPDSSQGFPSTPMGIEEYIDDQMRILQEYQRTGVGTQAELSQLERLGAIDSATDPTEDPRGAVRLAAMREAQRGGGRFGGAARGIGGFGMGAARVAPLVATGVNGLKFLNALPGRLAFPTREGMTMGLDQGGEQFMGIPFTNLFNNQASNEVLASWRDAFTSALPGWLGGQGGFLNFGEGQEINQVIHSEGYSRGQRERLFSSMADLRADGMLDIPTMGAQFDEAIRHGSASIEQFTAILESIPGAAQAAQMSVKEYQEQLHASSMQLSQGGLTYTESTGLVNAISTATGYRPEDSAKLVQNRNLQVLAANRSGMNPMDFYNDPQARARGAVMAPAQMFQMVTGKELSKEAIQDPQTQGQIRMMYEWGMGQDLFGVSFEQLMSQGLVGTKEMAGSAGAASELNELLGILGSTGDETLQFGNISDPSNRAKFDRRIQELLSGTVDPETTGYRDFIENLSDGDYKDDPTGALKEALDILGEDTRSRTISEQGVVSVALQGFAEDILKEVINNNENGVKAGAKTADRSNNPRRGRSFTWDGSR